MSIEINNPPEDVPDELLDIEPLRGTALARYVIMFKTITASDDALKDTYKLPYLVAMCACADHIAEALRSTSKGAEDLLKTTMHAQQLMDKVAEWEERLP